MPLLQNSYLAKVFGGRGKVQFRGVKAQVTMNRITPEFFGCC